MFGLPSVLFQSNPAPKISTHIWVLVTHMGCFLPERQRARDTTQTPLCCQGVSTTPSFATIVVISMVPNIRGQNSQEGSKRGRGGMPQPHSCLKAFITGALVLGLNMAWCMPNSHKIYTMSTQDCHLLIVSHTCPASAQTIWIAAMTHCERKLDPCPLPVC